MDDLIALTNGSDTRKACKKRCGVGSGFIWIGVDSKGSPYYYRWSKPDGLKHHYDIEGILIGRAM